MTQDVQRRHFMQQQGVTVPFKPLDEWANLTSVEGDCSFGAALYLVVLEVKIENFGQPLVHP